MSLTKGEINLGYEVASLLTDSTRAAYQLEGEIQKLMEVTEEMSQTIRLRLKHE